jgi:hypothetical protein
VKSQIGRRDLLGRAGVAVGGALAFGVLQSCSDSETSAQPAASPQVSDFPYEKHLPAGFQLDVASLASTLKQNAYAGYFQGGCCHGAFSALLTELRRAGAPFTELPLGLGKFGGGGVDGYGSICGAALGSVLILNFVVENATERKKMVTSLLRWYEGFAFPAYVPATNLDPAGKTLAFPGDAVQDPPLPDAAQVVPHSHLCHASVSGWCHANGDVDANGADKKSRCARLTADVAAKAAELLNAYLASADYGSRVAGAPPAFGDNCLVCHGNSRTPTPTVDPVVASGMECKTCHTTHTVSAVPTACTGCHDAAVAGTGFPVNAAHGGL